MIAQRQTLVITRIRVVAAAMLAVFLCASTAMAQPGKPGNQSGSKGDQPPAKQAEGQGGMMGGQQGMGGMGIT